MKRFLKPVTKQTEAPTSQTPTPNALKAAQTKQTTSPSATQHNKFKKKKRFYFGSDELIVQYNWLLKEI